MHDTAQLSDSRLVCIDDFISGDAYPVRLHLCDNPGHGSVFDPQGHLEGFRRMGTQLHNFADMIGLVAVADLAQLWGYSGPNDAFRAFCTRIGVQHVPGRPGWFDPRHVRHRLDLAQGIVSEAQVKDEKPQSLVEKRRMRLGTK